MNSFFIDVLKRVFLVMNKHSSSVEMKINWDGIMEIGFKEVLYKLIVENKFDIKRVILEVLQMKILISSHILIILAMLFLDTEKLRSLQIVEMEIDYLYDVDIIYLLSYFQ